MSSFFFRIQDSEIKTQEVLSFMKITGQYHTAHSHSVMNSLLKEMAKKDGIVISDSLLQQYADFRRMELGLYKADQMKEFLSILGVTLDQWEESLENELYRIELRNKYGGSIYIGDAWNILKTIPEIRNSVNDIVITKGKVNNVNADDSELQAESDIIRRVLKLHKSDDFSVYLKSMDMSSDDWEKNVSANVISKKLKEKFIAPITTVEIADILNRYPIIKDLIGKLIFSNVIRAKAEELDITVSDQELEEYVENFRRALELHKSDHFMIWLNAAGMTIEDFENISETAILSKKVFAKVDKVSFGGDIDKAVVTTQQFSDALLDVTMQKILLSKAKELKVTVPVKELQLFSDSLRRAYGYHKADVFKNHLDFYRLTIEDWENFVETSCIINKLKESLTTNKKVMTFLEENEEYYSTIKNDVFNKYLFDAFSQSKLEWLK